ncbi:MAG: hypothetical protein ACRDPQ_02435 [Nocardioidaceae bacterium]
MYFAGWLTAIAGLLVLAWRGAEAAVPVLAIGSAFLLIELRTMMVRPAPDPLPTDPASVDIEANRIRAFQQSLDERGTQGDR